MRGRPECDMQLKPGGWDVHCESDGDGPLVPVDKVAKNPRSCPFCGNRVIVLDLEESEDING